MAAFTLSLADNILKVRYLGPVREQLNNKKVLWARIDRDEESVSGKNATVPVHYKRNNQAGSGRADNGTLPTADTQDYKQAIVPMKYIYSRITVTGPTIAATRDNLGAFVRALDSEIRGCVRDMGRAANRQINSDGRDALAFWTAADDTSGTNVDDNQGNAFVHLGNSTTTCDLIDASDHSTVLGDSIVVTLGAEGASSYAVTWTGTVSGSADTDYLTLEDTIGKQMMGIGGIIDDGNPPTLSGGLHGLAVATNAWWSAAVFGNSGTKRDLTLALMQKPLTKIGVTSDFDESDVKFLLGNAYIRDKYEQLLIADRRYVNKMELDGGFMGLEYSGRPFVVDSQTKRNSIFYVTPESMKIYRMSDWDWMDRDGAVLHRVADKDAYEATMFGYHDLGVSHRNANGKLEDITD